MCKFGHSIIVSWDLFYKSTYKIEFRFLLDPVALGFATVVMIIVTSVVIYSTSYMSGEKFFSRFHILVLSFVVSIITLIFGVSMISIIVGWDGLGVTSYLLVIYYQRWKRSNAGIITALINRVGDVFILLAIGISLIEGGYNFNITGVHNSSLMPGLVLLLFFASITKRAQIPFSAWLPAAMAAPTPVSSLVHSSTLVTAGVYLIIRFQWGLVRRHWGSLVVLAVGSITIIIAGMRALLEIDIKKIVALSTLSQLGLMISAIGTLNWSVAYFHMITHAFTKALLFMRVGNLIHSSNDYQDLRKSKISVINIPLYSSLLINTNLRLRGFPFFAGFYSKDMWLESVPFGEFSIFIYLVFLIAVIITVLYSARLIFFLLIRNVESLSLTSEIGGSDKPEWGTNLPTFFRLWVYSLVSGSRLRWVIFRLPCFLFIPLELKSLTIKIILTRALLYFLVVCKPLRGLKSRRSWVGGNMWGLPSISSIVLSEIRLLKLNKASAYIEKTELSLFYLQGLYNNFSPQSRYEGGWGVKFSFLFTRLAGVLVLVFL